jgi:hypothetical protein
LDRYRGAHRAPHPPRHRGRTDSCQDHIPATGDKAIPRCRRQDHSPRP